ncbi:butyrophilin-like protein 10 [Simochromis diagramma]|uniref:butyrophilin-like protein 10 n=1 Tax=Simochromis diagramma TaxID=43689 RepID=UPI001A7F033B|nr:butyrophilin-like protein 10 [Simochromis diagramma]
MIHQLINLIIAILLSAGTRGREDGVVTVVVSEGSDAILPCSLSTNQNLEQKLFDWKKDDQKEVFLYAARDEYNNGRPGQDEQFRGRVSHFPQELQFGNASIIIRNTRLADSGVYTCDFPHLQPEGKTFRIKLDVELTLKDRSGEIAGAAPKPDIRILNTTEDGLQLKCEVRGASPEPKVEWRDSDGNILPAEEPQVSRTGERYDITLLTTVTRTSTDRFHCVATQEELSHKTDAQIYLHYQKPTEVKSCSPGVGSWIGGMCFGAIATLLLHFLKIKIKYHISRVFRRKQRRTEASERPENGDTELTLKSEPV